MTTFDAIFLGLLQGLTEFIPVSSSGHLAMAKFFLPVHDVDLSYIVLLHFGTVISIVAALYDDIWRLLLDFIKGKKYALHFAGLIILSMIPAVIIGVLFDGPLDDLFCNKGITIGKVPVAPYQLVGLAFLACASWVLSPASAILKERNNPQEATKDSTKETNKEKESKENKENKENKKEKAKAPVLKSLEDMTWQDALIIGLAQAIAVIPGLSRSGSTIYAGLVRNLKSEAAARFSFLMSVPIILGAVCKDFIKPEFRADLQASFNSASTSQIVPQIIGIVTAAISGYLAIKFLIKLVNRYDFHPFIVYLWIVGLLCIAS